MDDKLSTLLAAMELDECPLTNQFLYVEELGNTDGSFVIASIIKDQIEKNKNIILILCHNSVDHYYSISKKLNYNLMALRNSGKVVVFDILEKIVNENFLKHEKCLKDLYLDIRKQLNVWGNEKGFCVILENIGNLLMVGVKDVFVFLNYIRALTVERKNVSGVCCIHNFLGCPVIKELCTSIKHVADVAVILKDLETGVANDVSGHLFVKKRENNFLSCKNEYQYQLKDKSINVFVPGSINFL